MSPPASMTKIESEDRRSSRRDALLSYRQQLCNRTNLRRRLWSFLFASISSAMVLILVGIKDVTWGGWES